MEALILVSASWTSVGSLMLFKALKSGAVMVGAWSLTVGILLAVATSALTAELMPLIEF